MAEITLEQAFQIAIRQHQAGKLAEASQLYKQILTHQPNHVGALHYLGLIAIQSGKHDAAVDLIGRAVSVKPDYAQAHSNLGIALRAMGKRDDAIAAFSQAIELDPNLAAAHSNLGSALKEKGDIDEAIAAYRRAIALAPRDAQTHSNLGNALTDTGQLDEAISACRTAMSLDPKNVEAQINLGVALQAKGQIDGAIVAYRHAIVLNPSSAQAHFNLGSGLQAKGEFGEAAAAYRQAVALKPNYFQAQYNLATSLKGAGKIDEAIAAYQQAIAVQPNFSQAYINLGEAFKEQGCLDESIATYRRAIELNPDCHGAHSNLILTLHYHPGYGAAAIAEEEQRWNSHHAEPIGRMIHPAPSPGTPGAGWGEGRTNLQRRAGFIPPIASAGGINPALPAERLASSPAPSLPYAGERAGVRGEFASCAARRTDPHPNPLPRVQGRGNRMRIGYVSPDFCDHVVGRNLLPLFLHHDREQFEVYCYSDGPRHDGITWHFQQNCDFFLSIASRTDEEVAAQIREDRIDILVDLALHTAHNRLLVFARKPAVVQVTFAGYPGSTGLPAIDYRLSDPYLDPPGMDESIYAEKTIRLADSFWCYDPWDGRDVPVNSLPALSRSNVPALTAGVVTFGCLNNFCKVNETILALWAQILRQTSGSRLLLLAAPGSHRQRTSDFLAHQGVDSSRVEFLDPRPRLQYVALYHRIDISLDSFPYNGHTTSLDSFWMGVPVVTLVGHTAVSRAGWCQLSNLGLPELAGHTPDDFVRIARELAEDLPRLSDLRATLRGRMERSPLMDGKRFAANIESAYREMRGISGAPDSVSGQTE